MANTRDIAPDAVAGKTFVISGASSGLGRGVAIQLASRGAQVVLAARRTELLDEVADEARAAGGTARVVPTDVSRAEDVQALAEAAMDDPAEGVDAIVKIARDPREELAVGWKAKASAGSHKLTPDPSERLSGDVAHKWQIEDAPPAPPTTGTLYEPMPSGRTVEGGVRQRMERENAEREQRRH